MVTKAELKKLIGKKCWFYQGTLEILQSADSEIIDVEEKDFEYSLVIKRLGQIWRIPDYEIRKVVRKD